MWKAISTLVLLGFCVLGCKQSNDVFLFPARFFASSTPTEGDLNCKKGEHDPLVEDQALQVMRVADGDTFSGCLMPEGKYLAKVRVLGIDCPESKENDKCRRDGMEGRKGCDEQIPLGKKASKRARQLLLNKRVILESKRGNADFEPDVYGRVLAYVRLKNGVDYGKLLIEEHLCEDFSYKYPHPRQDEYLSVK